GDRRGGDDPDRLDRLAIALAVEHLSFGLCHAREVRQVAGKDPIELDTRQRRGESGPIPVVPVLQRRGILWFADYLARQRPLDRRIAHGDDTGPAAPQVAALDKSLRPAQPLRTRPAPLVAPTTFA